jgi:hypothetical protein
MFSGLSRRQLLRLIGGVIAGTTVFGSIPFLGKRFASKAQAQATDTSATASATGASATASATAASATASATAASVDYKNRTYKVVVKAVDNTPSTLIDGNNLINNPFNAPVELFLDGQSVSVLQNKQTGKYQSYLLPFSQYNSPDDLAKTLIDLHVSAPSQGSTSVVTTNSAINSQI